MIDFTLHKGDCAETLRGMPDNSIDSVVTDPPYGLSKEPDAADVLRHWLAGDDYKHTGNGFMGKSWDSFVPGPAVWREVLRVLKPGGHALVFAGSRTQDLMSMALRLAGFEIRDTVMWLYGSGFPKSLDVSKAVDAADAARVRRERALKFTAWMRSTGITARQIDEATSSAMGGHYLTDAAQPGVATLDMFEKMRHLLPEPPDDIMELMQWRTVESENMKRRAVVGTDTKARSTSGASALPTLGGETEYRSWDITTAHTDEAKQWEGWGTALKPAYEPIIIARKPLEGTVADNVLTHGVGAINVDGCRVGDAGGTTRSGQTPYGESGWRTGHDVVQLNTGRWPANILHDGSDEVLAAFPDAKGQQGIYGDMRAARDTVARVETDKSAARFFYCAKASKADREEGLSHLVEAEARTRKNHHPTVKPTELMRYLCRLATPPGGKILDPFAGSGSTGKAALLEGFSPVLCEMTDEYWPIIEARCAHALLRYVEENY